MKTKSLIVLLLLTIISCNNHDTKTEVSKADISNKHKKLKKSDNESSFNKNKDSLVAEVEKIITTYEHSINSEFDSATYISKDSVEIIKYYSKQREAKVLKITTYIPEQEDYFIETYYFGEAKGYPIIYTSDFSINDSEVETSIQAIFSDRNVLSYIRKDQKITYINKLSKSIKETKISALVFILINNIKYFDFSGVKFLSPILNSMPVMVTIKDNIPIMNSNTLPNKTNYILKKGSTLYYLGYQKNPTDDGNPIIWYKVATEDKKIIGWVQDNGNGFEYYTDGD